VITITHQEWRGKTYDLPQDEIVDYATTIIDPPPITWNHDASEIGKRCYLLYLLSYECGIIIKLKGDKNHGTNNTIRSRRSSKSI
jgi:hypothetical protein